MLVNEETIRFPEKQRERDQTEREREREKDIHRTESNRKLHC